MLDTKTFDAIAPETATPDTTTPDTTAPDTEAPDTTPATWGGRTATDYERALWQSLSGAAEPVTLYGEDGLVIRLEVGRYAAVADSVDRRLLEHCTGPTLDIGCGPGRLAAELARRGVPALGVDVAPVALLLARASGATVLGRSVFDRLPAEGRWPHALLIDGNIGISGDPAALLGRVKALLLPAGATLTVETAPHEIDERHWLRPPGPTLGPAIPWARIGPSALRAIAESVGYRCVRDRVIEGRRFLHLGT